MSRDPPVHDDAAWANHPEPRRRTFYLAAKNGDLEQLKASLHPGLDINSNMVEHERHCVRTALIAAVEERHVHIVGFLLAIGADLETHQITSCRGNALHAACRDPNPEMITLLLDAGADIEAKLRDGIWQGESTAVRLVVDSSRDHTEKQQVDRHCEALRILIARGANLQHGVGYWDGWGEGLCTTRAAWHGNVGILKILVAGGAKLDEDVLVSTCGVSRNLVQMIKYLVDELGQTDSDCRGLYSYTMFRPLDDEHDDDGYNRNVRETVRFLLSRAQDLTTRGAGLAFSSACQKWDLGMVKLFLDAGADVNVAGRNGATPFLAAAANDRLDWRKVVTDTTTLARLRFLIEHGADPHTRVVEYTPADRRWITPWWDLPVGSNALHFAAGGWAWPVVQYLLDIGVSPETRNIDGHTPLIAMIQSRTTHFGLQNTGVRWEPEKIAQFSTGFDILTKATQDINAADNTGRTAMHYLALFPMDEVLSVPMGILLQRGARLNIRDEEGETAAEAFQRKHGVSMKQFLMDECA